VELVTHWRAHRFEGETNDRTTLHVHIRNKGYRSVEIVSAGWVFPNGTWREARQAEGLPVEINENRGKYVWLLPPGDTEVEVSGWPTEIWVADHREREYGPYPGQLYSGGNTRPD
jgi:hypothetical protein